MAHIRKHSRWTIQLKGERPEWLFVEMAPLLRVESDAPAFFLNAEEALYCLNYARGLASQDDSVFDTCPYLVCVTPVLCFFFAPGPDRYVPAWEFVIASGQGDKPVSSYSIYVDAATGEIHTGTKEGGFPSPYR